MHRPRLLAISALAVAGLVAAAFAPVSQAAAPPGKVTGGISQAWQATPFVPVAPVKVPATTFYLSGTSQDQVNKLRDAPSATFGSKKPAGTTSVQQQTNPVLAAGGSSDKGQAYWTGAYRGTVDGPLTITWWWSTTDALAGGDNVIVHVYADPGSSQEKEIGTGFGSVNAVGTDPKKIVTKVNIKGTVTSLLQVSVEPRYVDSSQDLNVYYGSTSTPSSIEVPKGSAPPKKVPRNPAVRDTNPLVLAATRIGRKAAEPTIGVTKEGNAFIVAGDFDGLSPATPQTLIYGSYDGNRSWRDITPRIAGSPKPPTTLDPYMYVDEQTGRIFSDDLTLGCSVLQWSDDQGKTWAPGNPIACDGPVDDHQTLVTGRPPAGITTLGYPNVVYYCVNKIADAMCARSLDGGQTFRATTNPAFYGVQQPADGSDSSAPAEVCGGLHGHITTDPQGRLFLPKSQCGSPWVAVSEDGGDTWDQVRVNKMATAGTQMAITSDSAGNLYYVWWQAETLLPYMAVSTDHGQTWGTAKLVAPPGVQAVNFPSIDASTPGHVVITFPGSTEAAGPRRAWNYYVAVTDNALAARPVFHSMTANPAKDPVHRGICQGRCGGMFDFLDVVVTPRNEIWAAAVDTCTGTCVSGSGAAGDAQGVVIRQLSGPGLRRAR